MISDFIASTVLGMVKYINDSSISALSKTTETTETTEKTKPIYLTLSSLQGTVFLIK